MFEEVEKYDAEFDNANIPTEQRVSIIVKSFFDNAKDLKETKGIDFWLSLGVYLPAVERIIANQNGESEEEFYRRTQYPKHVVDAYTVVTVTDHYDDFATLICANYFRDQFLATKCNETKWQLNTDDDMLDLALFENRLRAV